MDTVPTGFTFTLVENTIYAIPPYAVYVAEQSGGGTLEVSNDGSSFSTLSGRIVTYAYIRSTGDDALCRFTQVDTVTDIEPDSVGTDALEDEAVTTAKIDDDAVTNAKLADMAAGTYKMRVTGSTGSPEDATAAQATAGLNNLVGDSGSGGTKGLAPAPAAGDAAANKFLKASGAWAAVPASALSVQKLSFTIDGGGSALSGTGLQKYFSFPFTGTINKVRVLGDASGNIVFDIWKDTWANRPPTNADSICASAKPTLSSAQFYEDTTLTGWTTSVTAGDLGGVEIESVSTLTWAVLEIFIQPA